MRTEVLADGPDEVLCTGALEVDAVGADDADEPPLVAMVPCSTLQSWAGV